MDEKIINTQQYAASKKLTLLIKVHTDGKGWTIGKWKPQVTSSDHSLTHTHTLCWTFLTR